MKRALVLTLCFVATAAAAPTHTAPSFHSLTINGNLLGNVVVLGDGTWAVALEDVARAFGAPITLEPLLSLQGNRLSANPAASNVEYKPQKADGSLDAGIHFKYDLKAQKEARLAPGQFLGVINQGLISSHVVMMNGKAYVPVADLVHAFGDGSVRGTFKGNMQPGQPVTINFGKSIGSAVAAVVKGVGPGLAR